MSGSSQQEIGRKVNFAIPTNEVSVEKYKKRLAQDRQPSTRTSTGDWINWSAMADILGQPFDVSKIPLSKLEQMQRDPILAFGLNFIKVPLIRAPWYIKSTDAKRAAFIDNALRQIYGRLILAYSNCFSFGYSAMVKRFEYATPDWTYIDKKDPDKREQLVWEDKSVQALVWKPFLALNPKNVAPHWNAKGEFSGIDLTRYGDTSTYAGFLFNSASSQNRIADIPLDWSLWATNEKDSVFGSLWGYPRLGYAYRYWWSYWYKFGLSDRAFEKWADPPVIVYHPSVEGLDEEGNKVNFADEGLRLAESIRSGANATLPSSVVKGFDERNTNIREWMIEQMKSETNFDALNESFKYLDVLKLRSLMVPEQALSEGQGGSSSRNVAEIFGDRLQESQAVIMQEIDDMINRYVIPQLLEANFGSDGPTCTKITTGFDPADVETMRVVVQAIMNKNGAIPDIDVREMLKRLGLPLLSPEDTQYQIEETLLQRNEQHQAEYERRRQEALLKGHKPPPINAKFGENAGVNEDGLYYDARERIELSDTERSVFKKIYDKISFKSEIKEVEA